jgi:Tetratricopeptide repeat
VPEAPTDEPDAPVEPEEPPPPTYRYALDRDLSPDLDVAALAQSAELTLERRIPGVGLDELLDLASAYRRDGRADAAIDTCYLALSLAPDDVGIHLALVELYDERGWQSLAGEKLDLLDRLTGLDADPTRAARVAAARSARA